MCNIYMFSEIIMYRCNIYYLYLVYISLFDRVSYIAWLYDNNDKYLYNAFSCVTQNAVAQKRMKHFLTRERKNAGIWEWQNIHCVTMNT